MKILAAGASARAVAESASRAGHEVLAVDMFGDRDLLAVASWRQADREDPGGSLASAALEQGVDAVVFASGVENNPDAVEYLRSAGVRVLAPCALALRRCRDTEELARVCARNHIARPRVFSEPSPGADILVKPKRGGSGIGIRDWDGVTGAAEDEYLQEKIGGVPLSVVFLADGRSAVLLGVSRQFAGEAFLGAEDYAWCGNLMPFDAPPEERKALSAELRRVVSALVSEFELAGACGADFILSGGVPWLLEINPRISASFELAELLTGINAFDAHLSALEGRLPEEREVLAGGPFRGKGIVYAPRGMTAPDTSGWLGTNRRDIPQAWSPLPRGLPICTVITPPTESAAGVMEYLREEAERVWRECS